MREVRVGVVGLGNVGGGTLAILAENREQIARKLGFPLRVTAVCSRNVHSRQWPASIQPSLVTADWREVVSHPEVDIVTELIGGAGVAREVVEGAIRSGKSVVTANKELIALAGPEIWSEAQQAGVSLAMEASVCGGIPIHAALREGIAGDRIQTLFGILNGTCNYILTEIEKHGAAFDAVLKEAQTLGYAEADPAADIEGYDARSKLALLAAVAFGIRVDPSAIYTEGISRIGPEDFHYAHQLGSTIRLLCAAKKVGDGLFLSVRPSLISSSTILASVQGAYNAVWVSGKFGADTFFYGRGAGPMPTGVAVVSDLMRVARETRDRHTGSSSPFAHIDLVATKPQPAGLQKQAWYLRFRVRDRPGIIAALAGILAECEISVDAILQLPGSDKENLPFVITLETSTGKAVEKALAQMVGLPFLVEPPLALPMETGL
jgi:homoserine dehydrogenase